MTKKAETKHATRPGNNGRNAEFLNIDLTEAQKSDLKRWIASDTFDPWTLVDNLSSRGYGFSVKLDTRNECIACYLIRSDEPEPGVTTLLVGRGRSVYSAVCGALYRHYVLLAGEWGDTQTSRFDLDDE
jgi:hypothetical protein